MEKNSTSGDELRTIRKMMEESTKFLSLSGFSGVISGIFAITGAAIAYLLIFDKELVRFDDYIRGSYVKPLSDITLQLMIDAGSVLLLSLIAAFYFSVKKAKQSGKSLWTPVSKRLLINLIIPLFTGGAFVLILLFQNQIHLIIPVMLIFYGLALVNAGKFTYDEIFYLGILEILTGLVAAVWPSMGLVFWILGFGILHILYGIFMYRKYEV